MTRHGGHGFLTPDDHSAGYCGTVGYFGFILVGVTDSQFELLRPSTRTLFLCTLLLLGSSCSERAAITATERARLTDAYSRVHLANGLVARAGELAAAKGSTGEIRSLGTFLERERRMTQRLVETEAEELQIALIDWLGSSSDEQLEWASIQESLNELQSTEGFLFDRAFLRFMLEVHRSLLARLRENVAVLDGVAAANYLTRMLPIFEEHVIMAQWCVNHCLRPRLESLDGYKRVIIRGR